MKCENCGHIEGFHPHWEKDGPACSWRNYPEDSGLSGEPCACWGFKAVDDADATLERVWAHIQERIGAVGG